MHDLVTVANYHCLLAENPLWNEQENRIYWTDIDAGRLYRAHHETLEHECFYDGGTVGGFTFQADGTLLLFEVNRISSLDVATGRHRVLIDGVDPEMVRFNDVIADPEGRVFAGTIGSSDENGGLYRIDPDGSVRVVWKGTRIANGMGFTGDLSKFYWTCTTRNIIYVADYDRASGELGNRRPFYVVPASEGSPDGACVDAEDTVWSARWGGHAVIRISPEGKVLERIELPVPNVTSVAFGGPQLDTLYITTASGRPGTDTEDGSVYRVRVAARGRPEFRSRILL